MYLHELRYSSLHVHAHDKRAPTAEIHKKFFGKNQTRKNAWSNQSERAALLNLDRAFLVPMSAAFYIISILPREKRTEQTPRETKEIHTQTSRINLVRR